MKNKKNILIILLIVVIIILILIYFLFLKVKSFTVTFDTDGGSIINSESIKEGQELDISNKPTKEGYTFIGWMNSENKLITKNTILTKDTTLKAAWISNDNTKVTVKFNTDGGNSIDDIINGKDNKIILPVDPIKKGYVFVGWINSDGYIIPDDMVVSGDITLTAYYVKEGSVTSKITFNTDGGNNINYIIVEKGAKIVLPIPPVKEGYVFDGWILENNEKVTKDTIISKDTILKAKWKLPYVCPDNCIPSIDGSTCTRTVTTNISKKTSCPSGYSSKSGKCVNYKTKYHALSISTSPFWKCNSSSDYMYSEVDGVGGAYMWCVKTTSKVTTEFCPSGYTKENDTCKKIETINCTLSK